MNRNAALAVLLGVAGTAAGFLLYYGCIMELGFGCPGSTFRPGGLLLQGVGESMLIIGLVLPRMTRDETRTEAAPKRKTSREPEMDEAEPEPEAPAPKPTVARATSPARAKPAASPNARLFFCPECGRHYKTVSGRYCPVDAAELKPMAR